jgi:hypothetical protein
VSHDAPEDVVRKAAYVLANPVCAGLVRTARDWPGLWTAPEQLGSTTVVAARPSVFFSPKGDMPERAELTLTTPAGFATAAEFQALVNAALGDLEEQKRREYGTTGFLGRERVLRQKPFARPMPREPRGELNPRIAAGDKWKRMEAIHRLVSFIRAYRSAWNEWRAGVRDVLFPAGTYQLRLEHRVRCAVAA